MHLVLVYTVNELLGTKEEGRRGGSQKNVAWERNGMARGFSTVFHFISFVSLGSGGN